MSRFIMVGGFLGAGKTTTIARLARHYQEQGLSVGVVTNDQATDLVDTQSLRAQGYEVGEVAGACFCCNFNELTATVERLSTAQTPDVILAEPVGSCTDLVATVIQPLRRLHGTKFDVAPYGVILKPSHGLKILREEAKSGFSPKAAYIFLKQLEEADFLLLNRIDELPPEEVSELARLLEARVPGVPVFRVSARTGEGFDAVYEMLASQGEFGRRILEIDYDVYAEGEAELGWLNSSVRVTAKQPVELDDLLMDLIARLQTTLKQNNAEPAHLKVIGLADGAYGVANLVSSDSPAELSLPARAEATEANVVVNARVAVDPSQLKEHVERAVREVCAQLGAEAHILQTQSFRPGRPVPTHRYSESV